MDRDAIKEVPPLTLEGVLQENNKLIYECLLSADRLYKELTTDSYLEDSTETEVYCIMGDVTKQNNNLMLLNKILQAINSNIMLGGKI